MRAGLFMEAYQHCCETMTQLLHENRVYIGYISKYREYFINRRNEQIIGNLIMYCPWCANALPQSLRKMWFKILEKEYGIDDPWNIQQAKSIPPAFTTDEWWKQRGL